MQFSQVTNFTREVVEEITMFYNALQDANGELEFKYSQHTINGNMRSYTDISRSPKIYTIRKDGTLIGLLETWINIANPNIRIIVTIAIAREYQRQGLATKLYNFHNEDLAQQIVHFRGNKLHLRGFYENLGFSGFREVFPGYQNPPGNSPSEIKTRRKLELLKTM